MVWGSSLLTVRAPFEYDCCLGSVYSDLSDPTTLQTGTPTKPKSEIINSGTLSSEKDGAPSDGEPTHTKLGN